MANRSMLLASKTKGIDNGDFDEREDVLAACNYSIPLFWLTLYSSDDISYEELELDDGSTIKVPRLVVEASVGLKNTRRQRNMVVKLITKKYNDLYNLWINYIEQINQKYIHLDLTEIMMMEDDFDKFNINIKNIFKTLDNNELDVINYDRYFYKLIGAHIEKGIFTNKVLSPKDSTEMISMLCGNSWIKKVLWD